MRKYLILIHILLLSVGLQAQNGNAGEEMKQHLLRLYLKSGDTYDFPESQVDSVTFTDTSQLFWQAGIYKTFNIENVDSVMIISPLLMLSTSDIHFGKVAVGNEKTISITLTNTGDYAETYMLVTGSPFSTSEMGYDIMLAAGQSKSLDIVFTPKDSVFYEGTLLIASRAINNGLVELPLAGSGVSAVCNEEVVAAAPKAQDFDIVVPEDETPDDFEGFSISNFYGNFPMQPSSMQSSVKRVRRADAYFNSYTATATVSCEGPQLHTVVNNMGATVFYTITLPGEKPEISFYQTAIALLMSCPYLSTTNEAEYRNAVNVLTKLESFDNLLEQVKNAYYEGKRNNMSPNYDNINLTPVLNELYIATKDTRELSPGGISLKNLTVTPQSAKFVLHNDFRRMIHMYPSRLKMNEENYVVVNLEDASVTFQDAINAIIEAQRTYAETGEDTFFKEMLTIVDSVALENVQNIGNWMADLEEEYINAFMAANPNASRITNLHLPTILNSKNANYMDIVWDSFYEKKKSSPFAAETGEIEIEFGDFDKIQLDIYGIGKLGDESWESYTLEEKSRLILALLWGGYEDVVTPLWKVVTGASDMKRAIEKNFKYDLRHGHRKYWARRFPEVALMMKLLHAFSTVDNLNKVTRYLKNEEYVNLTSMIVKFVLKEMTKMPKEDVADPKSYVNLIYNIYKIRSGNLSPSKEFINKFKDGASKLLGTVNLVLKTVDFSEGMADVVGTGQAVYNSNIKETHMISRYDKPYIIIKSPLEMTSDLRHTIHFEWETYKSSYGGWTFYYDLEMNVVTADEEKRTTVKQNIEETHYDYDMSQLSIPNNAQEVLFRIIAHGKEMQDVYAQTDFLPLKSFTATNVPIFYDLGLPSGNLWAACNLGASSPEESGDYYAWGEITGYQNGKNFFTWDNYRFGTQNSLTKYCTKKAYGNNGMTDGLSEMQGSDDITTSSWGYNYTIPTKEDWDELIRECEWVNMADKGAVVRGPNGQIIMLPFAGYRSNYDLYDAGKEGYYWSSTLDELSPDDAWMLHVTKGKGKEHYDYYRCHGRSIRPVLHKTDTSLSKDRSNAPQRRVSYSGENGLQVKTACGTQH